MKSLIVMGLAALLVMPTLGSVMYAQEDLPELLQGADQPEQSETAETPKQTKETPKPMTSKTPTIFEDEAAGEPEAEEEFVPKAVTDWRGDSKVSPEVEEALVYLYREMQAMKAEILTEQDVRQIVREELAILRISRQDGQFENRCVNLSAAGYTSPVPLAPGETIVAINGVPVQPERISVPSYQEPVYSYRTAAYEVRTTSPPRGQSAPAAVTRSFARTVTRPTVSGIRACRGRSCRL